MVRAGVMGSPPGPHPSLAALTAWVRARPEIVHDDPVTRAFFGVGGIGSTSGKDDPRAAPAG